MTTVYRISLPNDINDIIVNLKWAIYAYIYIIECKGRILKIHDPQSSGKLVKTWLAVNMFALNKMSFSFFPF